MLPRFARAELRVGGSPRAKFLWKIFILRGEWRRREIRPPKVCVFHLSVNQYCRENTLQNGSNFGSLPHPYTSISGWILPHVFLHYPKDPRNAFRWDLNILLNCGVPYPAVSCSARVACVVYATFFAFIHLGLGTPAQWIGSRERYYAPRGKWKRPSCTNDLLTRLSVN